MKIYSLIFLFILTSSYALAVPTKTNPDISLNILLLGQKSFKDNHSKEESHEDHENHEDHDTHGNHEAHQHSSADGVSIQEIELYFKSNIDPYWEGNVSIGLAQHGSSFELNVEEAYIDSLFIPNFTLRAGKFFTFLGRHNTLHAHYYPFIDPPLINQHLFGFHGLNGTGASLAYLAPLPWYSEIAFQAVKGKSYHGVLFLKNLWDLSDQSSLQLNLSYIRRLEELADDWKNIYNVALTLKWQALNSLKSLNWTTELMSTDYMGEGVNRGGANSYLQYRFLKSWWIEGRADFISNSFTSFKEVSESQKYSVLLAFTPTEYSAIRLQFDSMKVEFKDWSYTVALQTNMSLGSHPAHLY